MYCLHATEPRRLRLLRRPRHVEAQGLHLPGQGAGPRGGTGWQRDVARVVMQRAVV